MGGSRRHVLIGGVDRPLGRLLGQGAMEEDRHRTGHDFVLRIGMANGIDSRLRSWALGAAGKKDDWRPRRYQLQLGADPASAPDGMVANHNGIRRHAR
jgi:hypothetical protein